MSSITAQEQTVRQRVIEKMWSYLDTTFQNFSEANKIKIIVALLGKTIPQQVEPTSTPIETKVVIIRDTNGNKSQDGGSSRPVSVIRV